MSAAVKIEGLGELHTSIVRVKVTPEVAKKAIWAGALVLWGHIKSYTPVRTGKLLASILARMVEDTTMLAEAEIYTDSTVYAGFVEFGTRKMAARPYFRRGIDNHADQVLDTVAQTLADDLGID